MQGQTELAPVIAGVGQQYGDTSVCPRIISPTVGIEFIVQCPAGTSMEAPLNDKSRGRQIYGSPSALKKAKADKKFAYVVALARAINALNSVHSLMMSTANRNTPEAMRDRMNGNFFVSGILYETLRLIRAMSGVFRDDISFATSFRLVLRIPRRWRWKRCI